MKTKELLFSELNEEDLAAILGGSLWDFKGIIIGDSWWYPRIGIPEHPILLDK